MECRNIEIGNNYILFRKMNFYSALCLIHPPDKLEELRGHYTDGNILYARAGTKKLSSFSYKIDFNKIFFQQKQVYNQTTSQIFSISNNNDVTTMLILTTNENYRFQFLRQIIRQSEGTFKAYMMDFKKLNKEQDIQIQDIYDETEIGQLQQLTYEALEILKSQIKHRRSMNSRKICLKIVLDGENEFILNLLQVNLTSAKDTQVLHKQFKLLFSEGIIDQQQYGPRSKQLNESNNILLLTYLTFEQKKRIQQQCYSEFLSRIQYSSEVQRMKENRYMEKVVSQLTKLRETKQRLGHEISFYKGIQKDLNSLVGKELAIIRKLNIKYKDVAQHKTQLKQGIKRKLEQNKQLRQEISTLESIKEEEQEQPEELSNFFKRMKQKLKGKLQSLNQMTQNGSQCKFDLNQSSASKSICNNGRPKSSIRSRYLDVSKSIIGKQNNKVKNLVNDLQKKQKSILQCKKQQFNTLPELAELYNLTKQMSEQNRNRLMVKYGI